METKAWKINEAGIVRSIENVLKSGDIEKLTKDAYNFVNILSGFIAHYNHGGFKAHYANVEDFRRDLDRSSDTRDFARYMNDPYFAKNDQKEYYQAKARICLKISRMVKTYENALQAKETDQIADKIQLLKELTKRAENDPIFAKAVCRKLELI